ncbi:MAG: hypothetical protein AAF958_09615 [Planctomycetota bacterium]
MMELSSMHDDAPCTEDVAPCTEDVAPCIEDVAPCTEDVAPCTEGDTPFTDDVVALTEGVAAPVQHSDSPDLAAAVDQNTRRLDQLIEILQDGLLNALSVTPQGAAPDTPPSTETIEQLQTDRTRFEQRCIELEVENEKLLELVEVKPHESAVAAGKQDSLTWEERKQLILQQLEQDTYDADQFLTTLRDSGQVEVAEGASPEATLDDWVRAMQHVTAQRDELHREVAQLRQTLDERASADAQAAMEGGGVTGTPEMPFGDVAVGAAALAGMLDASELVQEEQQRLRDLQNEWEAKFRKLEVETSLERAKLSRERQQLVKRLSELEDELAQSKRSNRVDEETGRSARRWLAKLGLED